MEAELNGEVRPIIRHLRGVLWCPFCDFSHVATALVLRCFHCAAIFRDPVVEIPVPETPSRKRRTVTTNTEETETTILEDGDAVL